MGQLELLYLVLQDHIMPPHNIQGQMTYLIAWFSLEEFLFLHLLR